MPGAGQVEEETIDDDELELEPLRRHADDHDGDDLVEETMEHSLDGADIGEFVRDTYVNERTSPVFDGEAEDEEGEDSETGDVIIESEEPAEQAPGAQRQRRGRRGRKGQLAQPPREERKEERRDDRRTPGARQTASAAARRARHCRSSPSC